MANNLFRPQGERTYSYNGFTPYGAGELFALDHYVDYDFTGNVTEYLISSGAKFEVISEDRAILRFADFEIPYVRGENE